MALDTQVIQDYVNGLARRAVKGELALIAAAAAISAMVGCTRVVYRGSRSLRVFNHSYSVNVDLSGLDRRQGTRMQELAVLVDAYASVNRNPREPIRSEFYDARDSRGNVVSTKHHGFAEYREQVWAKYARAA